MSERKKHSRDQADADLAVLRASSPQDFDGHTEFYRLTPLQRLAWLDEAVAFIGAAKSTNRSTAHDPGGSDQNLRVR
jgi:hypothetical protein